MGGQSQLLTPVYGDGNKQQLKVKLLTFGDATRRKASLQWDANSRSLKLLLLSAARPRRRLAAGHLGTHYSGHLSARNSGHLGTRLQCSETIDSNSGSSGRRIRKIDR